MKEMRDAEIERAVADLTSDGLSTRVSPTLARHISARTYDRAYQAGRRDAIAELMTTEQVAAILGVIPRRVRALAQSRRCGWSVGRDWIFRPEDLEVMRDRRPGRPPSRADGDR